ncbi:hypothetical protein DAEQUDRAFT_726572 [Daedalea quercina L-15889]|uniref:Uncharacterized protein n=1 Tax=Daedalea quercina L-15889 TaxID=1314783 RepID=A0A165QKF7_9APHY|nr:hypothetical protein DAEQUDRAFT_726572 [Daedalea quercina L-15889]
MPAWSTIFLGVNARLCHLHPGYSIGIVLVLPSYTVLVGQEGGNPSMDYFPVVWVGVSGVPSRNEEQLTGGLLLDKGVRDAELPPSLSMLQAPYRQCASSRIL